MMRYTVYYGPGGPGMIDGYELAILSPGGWTAPQRRALQAGGARLLAYLSLLEVPIREGPPPANVLRIAGRPAMNLSWNNWVLDPRHPLTEQHLLREVQGLRIAGWDGIFFDTIGTAESPEFPPELRGQLIAAAARLVGTIALAWPEAVRVQNWGFGPLLPLVAPFLHGVCWENFPYRALALREDTAEVALAGRLRRWADVAGLVVLALNEGTHDADLARGVAAQWGFGWYGAPGTYTAPPTPASP